MAPFEYRPLESARHVRLLTLTTADEGNEICKDTDRLVAKLEHVCIDDAELPPYEPVSYVWTGPTAFRLGDPAAQAASRRNRALATTNGHTLAITESLQAALPFLRGASETGRLWIDQICIDQDNVRERSPQVAIMHDIYAKGVRGLVFLDGEYEHAAYVQRIARLHQMARDPDHWEVPIQAMPTDEPSTLARLTKDPTVLRLAMRHIWTRAWVSGLVK